ncbi:MAG: hypothetical protein J1F38_05125 [Muribaculaceae bacterium]|nr:hypothetical protein [Muribaculaceae bacterium]
MPRIRRHRPGQYKEKEPIQPNFTGVKPLTVFQDENGKWGAKAGDGKIEIPAAYELAPQTDDEKQHNIHRLVSKFEVLQVSPDDWDVIFFYSPD